jgi:hypothetical protein
LKILYLEPVLLTSAAFPCVRVQGTVFAVIGFVAGIAGTSISNGLIVLRKNLDPNFKVVVSRIC